MIRRFFLFLQRNNQNHNIMNDEIKTLIEDEKLNLTDHLSGIADAMAQVVYLAEEAGRAGRTPHTELLETTAKVVDVLKLYANLLEEIAELQPI